MNTYQITVLPYDRILNADEGENLLHVLQQNSLAPDAPCGFAEGGAAPSLFDYPVCTAGFLPVELLFNGGRRFGCGG